MTTQKNTQKRLLCERTSKLSQAAPNFGPQRHGTATWLLPLLHCARRASTTELRLAVPRTPGGPAGSSCLRAHAACCTLPAISISSSAVAGSPSQGITTAPAAPYGMRTAGALALVRTFHTFRTRGGPENCVCACIKFFRQTTIAFAKSLRARETRDQRRRQVNVYWIGQWKLYMTQSHGGASVRSSGGSAPFVSQSAQQCRNYQTIENYRLETKKLYVDIWHSAFLNLQLTINISPKQIFNLVVSEWK